MCIDVTIPFIAFIVLVYLFNISKQFIFAGSKPIHVCLALMLPLFYMLVSCA